MDLHRVSIETALGYHAGVGWGVLHLIVFSPQNPAELYWRRHWSSTGVLWCVDRNSAALCASRLSMQTIHIRSKYYVIQRTEG